MFNWVRALSSYSWETIGRPRSERRDKGVKGSARVVFKLIVSAERDARPQEEGARMGGGDKGAEGKMRETTKSDISGSHTRGY